MALDWSKLAPQGFAGGGERVVPVATDLPGWREGRAWLRSVALLRLGVDPAGSHPLDAIIERAAEASGGVPLAFLQLLQDAGMYGKLGGRELPNDDDLRDAMSDHAASLRRLLKEGDVAALREAHGTGQLGGEGPRNARLFGHGLVLRYDAGERGVVQVNPLLQSLLSQSNVR